MISFSIPSPTVSSFQIWLFGWQISIHYYALFILAGIIVATVWTSRRLTKRGAEPGIVLDFVLWSVPLGIIGARFYHVFTHPSDYFGAGMDPWGILQIWNGGNAIFGALIGGAVGVWIASRQTGIRFLSFADALVPGLLAAQAFGRLGNYFNQELFGLPTNLPWGLVIDAGNPAIPVGLPAGVLFHPTFLYEMMWNVIGIAVILFIEKRYDLRWGRLFALYLIWYGIGRSFLESIRVDPSEMFLGVRTNIWAAWAAVLLGIVLSWMQYRRHPGRETSVYRDGSQWLDPATLEFDETVDSSVASTDTASTGVPGATSSK